MNNYESNNSFLSYEGRINRKNYIINMFILIALYIAVSIIRFDSFAQYFSFDFFNTILIYLIELFKFIIIIAIMSVIYRRMADFDNLTEKTKKIFFILFLFPFIYLNWGHYLFNFMPLILQIFDIITIFVLLPLGFIATIVFAFLKSKN